MWRMTFLCFGLLAVASAAFGQQQLQPSGIPEGATQVDFVAAQPGAPTPAPLPVPDQALPPSGPALAAPPMGAGSPCCSCTSCRRVGAWQGRIKPCLQYSHWGYADQFEETPFGASVCQAKKVQICNGLADQIVLYLYDFCMATDGAQLNLRGRRRLSEIVTMMQSLNCHPLLIEASGNPELDAARKAYVLEMMAKANFPVPEDWVVVGQPKVRGLAGEEAVIIHSNMLRQTEAAATRAPGDVGTGATFAPLIGIGGGGAPAPQY